MNKFVLYTCNILSEIMLRTSENISENKLMLSGHKPHSSNIVLFSIVDDVKDKSKVFHFKLCFECLKLFIT